MADLIKHSGGQLLQQGLYGCIFAPALKCANGVQPLKVVELDKTNPILSKIISKDTAIIEYTIGQKIRRIPLWKNYYAVSESMCIPSAKQTDKDIKQCEPIQGQKTSDLRILTMRYNGVSLNAMRLNLKTFDLIAFATHILEAGALMTLHGIVHRDLHSKNVIVDQYNVPRLIDFNLSILNYKNITAHSLSHSYSPTLFQLSPDYILMNALDSRKPLLTSAKIMDDIIYKRSFTKTISNILGISINTLHAQFKEFYNHSNAVRTHNMLEWFNEHWAVIDSWAIGSLVIYLITRFIHWPVFAPVLQAAKPTLFPVLRSLLSFNPLTRLDCIQALYHLNPHNKIVERFGKNWIAEKGAGELFRF